MIFQDKRGQLPMPADVLLQAKKYGFSDKQIAKHVQRYYKFVYLLISFHTEKLCC